MYCCAVDREGLIGVSGDFFEIKEECRDDAPKTRFKPMSRKTLSARRWHSSFSDEGYLNIARVLRRVQRGVRYLYIKFQYPQPFLFGKDS
ncbi:hypothetical protein Taro_034705 [Colocasia esculenta]|uniref:Uncharacterized protein n=1 Tax=Colocasia esculenta TaxID=4460 RepID=A0A843WCN6_COLES|nr:hypothetical protein [Colocasia esculenta]